MNKGSQRVPVVRVRVGPPKDIARGSDELMGRKAARCIDCGLYTSVSHAGRCGDIARAVNVPETVIKRLREGERDALVATPGMRGKRVRRNIATMDISACALEKGLSIRDTGRVLGRLARAFNRQARLEAEEKLQMLREHGTTGVFDSDE